MNVSTPMGCRHRAFALATILASAVAWSSGVAAHDFSVGDVQVMHPWAAPPPPGAPSVAGYLEVRNDGDTADRLLGATAAFAERVELHESRVEDDVVSMRPLGDGIALPPGQTVRLAPGGMHLMFVRPEPLGEGDRRSATLQFERAGSLTVEFVVERPEASEAAPAAAPMDHSHHLPTDPQ